MKPPWKRLCVRMDDARCIDNTDNIIALRTNSRRSFFSSSQEGLDAIRFFFEKGGGMAFPRARLIDVPGTTYIHTVGSRTASGSLVLIG